MDDDTDDSDRDDAVGENDEKPGHVGINSKKESPRQSSSHLSKLLENYNGEQSVPDAVYFTSPSTGDGSGNDAMIGHGITTDTHVHRNCSDGILNPRDACTEVHVPGRGVFGTTRASCVQRAEISTLGKGEAHQDGTAAATASGSAAKDALL